MTDVITTLAGVRSAVDDLRAAGDAAGPAWAQPRAPGKWSPSQIVEHVARALEESANVVAGAPSLFPTFPALARPIVRTLFFNRVVRNKTFPKARTTRPMNPLSGPATPAEGSARLEQALSKFEDACRACAQERRSVASGLFGVVSVEDFAEFQALHTRHHLRQMSDGAAAQR